MRTATPPRAIFRATTDSGAWLAVRLRHAQRRRQPDQLVERNLLGALRQRRRRRQRRPNLTGTWYANGDRSRSCSISQTTWQPYAAKRIGAERDRQLQRPSDHDELGRYRHQLAPSRKVAIASTGTTGPTGFDSESTEIAAIAIHRNFSMRYIDREEVARRLTYDICIPLVRDAMIAFSAGETRQLLRSIIPLAEGHLFGIMPGALGAKAPFGAKLISIFPENAAQGRQSHQGLIVPLRAGHRHARLHRPRRRGHRHPHRSCQRRCHRRTRS